MAVEELLTEVIHIRFSHTCTVIEKCLLEKKIELKKEKKKEEEIMSIWFRPKMIRLASCGCYEKLVCKTAALYLCLRYLWKTY